MSEGRGTCYQDDGCADDSRRRKRADTERATARAILERADPRGGRNRSQPPLATSPSLAEHDSG